MGKSQDLQGDLGRAVPVSGCRGSWALAAPESAQSFPEAELPASGGRGGPPCPKPLRLSQWLGRVGIHAQILRLATVLSDPLALPWATP